MMTRKRRATIRPFLRGTTWWARVPRLNGPSVQRSLGIRGRDQREAAEAVCAFLWTLKSRRDEWILDEMAAGRVRVGEAYDAHRARRLERFIAERQAGLSDPDLEPMVDRWWRHMQARGRPRLGTAWKYVKQVRTLIPGGKPFPRSALTRRRISEWLDGLGITQPNRHRAALSRFCGYLVERDLLPANPVHHVQAAAEHEPRCRYLSESETAAVLGALEEPFKTAHALMASTGMEISAVLALRRQDVAETPEGLTVRARGTKRASRDRVVRIIGSGAERLLRARLAALLPAAKVFPSLTHANALAALRAACTAVGIADYRTHDWRHTFAVRELRAGRSLQVVAHQLGHLNTIMAQRVYGRFVPEALDYAPRLLRQSATTSNYTAEKSAGNAD